MKRIIGRILLLFLLPVANAKALTPSLGIYVFPPVQVGRTENVELGMAVSASTPLYALSVAGGFTATCPESQPIQAQASASSWAFLGGVSVSVQIPRTVTGQYPMSGWSVWPSPSTQSCRFNYIGRAKEGIFNLGGAGSSITFGGGDKSEGDTLIFRMVKPTPGTGSGTCWQ